MSVPSSATCQGCKKQGFSGKQGLRMRDTCHFRRFQGSEVQGPCFCGQNAHSSICAVFVKACCFRQGTKSLFLDGPIRANRLKVPELNPLFFCESRFRGLKTCELQV